MPIDTGARHRLLLSLRSEKAMGLSSIRRPLPQPVAAVEVETSSEAVIAPPANPSVVLPLAAPPLTTEQKRSRLLAMQEKEVRVCTKCRLSQTRTQTVFGEGDIDAKIMFVGEGPGENEDLTGRPFVGRAGQLLDKMIAAMGLRREQVYIANIVKCRPPQNRVPALDEVATCTPYLERQIEIIRPKVIVTLGRPSASYMLGNPKLTMGSVRGRWHEWRQIKLMPTFHPSYVLRTYTEEVRKAVWDDLKKVMEEVAK
jgi:uracil-DNA glycosylase